jgi:CheY-like chemotaxis protein
MHRQPRGPWPSVHHRVPWQAGTMRPAAADCPTRMEMRQCCWLSPPRPGHQKCSSVIALGHKVETFATAAEFVKVEIEKLLCLVVDHHMPGMTGLDLAERLRTEGNTVPIMLTTGLPSHAIYARPAELGIDEVLEKPFDEALLLAFIDTAKRRV